MKPFWMCKSRLQDSRKQWVHSRVRMSMRCQEKRINYLRKTFNLIIIGENIGFDEIYTKVDKDFEFKFYNLSIWEIYTTSLLRFKVHS